MRPLYGQREMELGIWTWYPFESFLMQTLYLRTSYLIMLPKLSTGFITCSVSSQYLLRCNSMLWSGTLPVQNFTTRVVMSICIEDSIAQFFHFGSPDLEA